VPQSDVPVSEVRAYLEKRLPAYMVPSYIYSLPEIPLQFNGKLNRELLPVPESASMEAVQKHVSPRDLLQSQLVRIWEKVLNYRPVGIHDNFFDLGGHSLLALKLCAEIEKQTGKNLPLASLLSAQTIETLSRFIQESGYDLKWSSLVPVQTKGSNPPLFLMHPVGGTILRYRLLAKHLGTDQPVYGLQARGLDGEFSPLTEIQEMAALYIREMQNVQPNGPYSLGGYSFGGVLAFEIAQQLQQMGEKVKFLAMFDSVPPTPERTIGLFPALYRRVWMNARELITDPESKLKVIMKKYGRGNSNKPPAGRGAMHERFRQVQKVNRQAFASYVPQFYPGTIHLFVAKDFVKKKVYDVEALWRPLCEHLVICPVPGNHANITHEPNVKVLADRLKSYLIDVH
jgi:aspartate racemase